MSPTQVKRFNFVETHGTDELKEKISNNEISIRAAESVAHLSRAQQREVLQNEDVTSTTVKNHTEKKEKKKAQRKDTAILKENKKISLQKSDTFMKYLQDIKNKSEIFNRNLNIELDKDDFEILIIYIKKLSRSFDEITRLINKNNAD